MSDATANNTSLAELIYNSINNAIGGINPDQYITLMLPGTILNEKDYAISNNANEGKSAVVEANESRLANKMFDPCKMTGNDNGFSLPYQYKMALDMLTPKINRSLGEYKNKLRQLLISEYPYDFGDGSDKVYTLQEVYFRLYDEYVEEMHRWNDLQQQKKDELRKEFEIDSDYERAYLEWYENNADLYLNEINEKRSKVLSVFSPNDMKILEGVLDSGCGAELQEARQTLNNVRKITPEGGYVYPVRFVPSTWYKQIGTSFTSADLIKSPETLSEELQMLTSRKIELFSFVYNVAILFEDNTIGTYLRRVQEAKDTLERFQSNMVQNYGPAVRSVLYSAVNLKSILADDYRKLNIILRNLPRTTSRLLYRGTRNEALLISAIKSRLSRETELQKKYAEALGLLVSVVENYIARVDENKSEKTKRCEKIVRPVIKQLKQINSKIEDLQTQITISTQFFSSDKANKDNNLKSSDSTSIVPSGFTHVVIHSDSSSLTREDDFFSKQTSRSSVMDFLFLGKRVETETSTTSENYAFSKVKCAIDIDMNVAKVGIERDWFNPGLFALTKDMLKLGDSDISPKRDDYGGMTDERFSEMRKCVFPSYPVAMILARDIKISLKFDSAKDVETYYKDFERHAKYGGSFFIFRGSESNSSFSTSRVYSTITDESTITLKFDTTQLIGYYMEATRPDKSVQFDTLTKQMRESKNFSSISEFVTTYKRILDSANRVAESATSEPESPSSGESSGVAE